MELTSGAYLFLMASLILNPILTRELRARWRGGRSMVLVFGYVALLAFTTGLLYASSSISNDSSQMTGQMARVGHDLFLTLSGLQIVAWMLIAPALTATGIAGERERGLLDMLQLTPLSPARICGGKLGSSLLLVLLLMFAPLPVTSLCFLLGGVSPGEFGIALALQTATIASGMCLGLWASSRSRRAISAMTSTFALVIGWALLTVVLLIAHESGSAWVHALPGDSVGDRLKSFAPDFAWRTNPLIIFFTELTQATGRSTSLSWTDLYLGVDIPDWLLNVVAQSVAALLLWISAARTLRKPLPDAGEETIAKPRRKLFGRGAKTQLKHQLSPTTAAIEYSMSDANVAKAAVAKANFAASNSVWRQWDWLFRFRSGNPMLEREVRRRARFRRLPKRSRATARIGVSVAAGLWILTFVRLLTDPSNRAFLTWGIITFIAFLVILGFVCVQGALSFTREHEAGTWEGIHLSLLSPRQMLWGKVLPIWGLSLLMAAFFWTPTLLCVDGVLAMQTGSDHLTPQLFFGTVAIACTTSWSLLCWGVFWSTHLKRVWPAVVWTIGSLLFLYIAVPALVGIAAASMSSYGSDRFMMTAFRLWHPLFAFIVLSDDHRSRYGVTSWGCVLQYCLVALLIGGVLLWLSQQQLKRLVLGASRRGTTRQSSAAAQTPATKS
jgi:ABC-type transport system involved in multi-copper enzyme maturation permease subunit